MEAIDENQQPETEEMLKVLLNEIIKRAIPRPPKVLSFSEAGNCLKTMGKIWNFGTNLSDVCQECETKLLDMEGFVEEYQYLRLEAQNMNLTDVQVIPENFVWLISIDLSGNDLTNVTARPLTRMTNLVSLSLDRNEMEDPYLPPFKHLQRLSLNGNGIESLHGIHHPNLETLKVALNSIKEIDSEDCFKLNRLKELDLHGNLLSSTKGIQYKFLVGLYLAENVITRLEGIHLLSNLEILHLRGNPLSDLTGFTENNRKLEYLNLRNCQISEIEQLEKLRVLVSLKVLVCTGNPFRAEEDEEIRIRIPDFLPGLTRIDKEKLRE